MTSNYPTDYCFLPPADFPPDSCILPPINTKTKRKTVPESHELKSYLLRNKNKEVMRVTQQMRYNLINRNFLHLDDDKDNSTGLVIVDNIPDGVTAKLALQYYFKKYDCQYQNEFVVGYVRSINRALKCSECVCGKYQVKHIRFKLSRRVLRACKCSAKNVKHFAILWHLDIHRNNERKRLNRERYEKQEKQVDKRAKECAFNWIMLICGWFAVTMFLSAITKSHKVNDI
jgi:hypothetical protein